MVRELVVKNLSGVDLQIVELKRIVPADGKMYVLPHDIALKYQKYLIPIMFVEENQGVLTVTDNETQVPKSRIKKDGTPYGKPGPKKGIKKAKKTKKPKVVKVDTPKVESPTE